MTSSSIQSVDRAARILKALAAGSPRLGVSELADRLGMAKTTVVEDRNTAVISFGVSPFQFGPTNM